MNDDIKKQNGSKDTRKEWESPKLTKEDMSITQGGSSKSPTRENPFYHT